MSRAAHFIEKETQVGCFRLKLDLWLDSKRFLVIK